MNVIKVMAMTSIVLVSLNSWGYATKCTPGELCTAANGTQTICIKCNNGITYCGGT